MNLFANLNKDLLLGLRVAAVEFLLETPLKPAPGMRVLCPEVKIYQINNHN